MDIDLSLGDTIIYYFRFGFIRREKKILLRKSGLSLDFCINDYVIIFNSVIKENRETQIDTCRYNV